jgi:D-alanyl-D-alanine carboxypeptidase (penicillin-binding protein 5/6)
MRTVIASAALLLLAGSPAFAEDVVPAPAPAAEQGLASPTPTAAEGLQVPDFATKSWILVDADSGDILAGQDYDEQRPMASTIKTLTSLTLLPRLQYDSVYEAQPQETLTEGAHVGVLSGNTYTVSQLFHGMLMRSGNDAAVALADAYGYQRTLAAMNAEAQRVGATSTVAKSPNGLDRPGQVSTAKDLAQIYRVAIRDPRLQEILTAKQAEFPAKAPTDPTKARTTFTIYNHDTLLNSGYPGFMGGKSGFTSQAGRTYVAGVQHDGRTFVVALLGIGGGTTETAREVFDWAVANSSSLSPIGTLPAVPDAPEIAPEPAGRITDDLAPMPIDEATKTQLTTIAQSAAQVASQAGSVALPSVDTVVSEAQAATAQVVSATGATTVPAGLGVGADAAVTGLSQSPFVAAEPAPEQRSPGFLASLLLGLFKAFAWLMLLLGIAVVLLRVRAVRRQKARREAMLRRRAQQTREPARL